MDKFSNKKVVVVGYGSQGHAHALNLKDSGVDVTVGLREGSDNWKVATDAGLKVDVVEGAVKDADVVMILTPDEVQADLFKSVIEPNLKKGAYLGFGHGFNILYGKVAPKEDVNIFMCAPKGPGHMVRKTFLDGSGTPCLVAVHADPSGDTREVATAWANGVNGGRAAILETNFKEETETDLFGEQAVLCGGVSELMYAGFETLVEAGYSPEMAYLECVHEMKLIVDMVVSGGFESMRSSISNTAEYGDYVTGSKIITSDTKKAMKEVLTNIQNGSFAKEFTADYDNKFDFLKSTRKAKCDHEIESVGKEIRKLIVMN